MRSWGTRSVSERRNILVASYITVSVAVVLPLWTRFENAPVLVVPILIVFGVLQMIQPCPRCGHRVMKNRAVSWPPRECQKCGLPTTTAWDGDTTG